MCGITGFLNLNGSQPPAEQDLRQMLAMIRHRGPDGFGIYTSPRVGLGSARLKIIDLQGGDQPLSNEDGTLWIVFNGEIFNYLELRTGLEARGHRFRTHSDTEVIVHLYEECGPECMQWLNGQFAVAIWDEKKERLFLARDRMGIRPLFYTIQDGRLIFGSEIKAILAHPGVRAEIDITALGQIFQYWSTISPRTVFKNIQELPPASYLLAQGGQITQKTYWSLDFSIHSHHPRPLKSYLEELESLLVDATNLQLRSDVPVGAYLSGGLDSSLIAAIVSKANRSPLDTFSITFSDPEFDESAHQRRMADFLGTDHQVVYARHEDIGRVFPEVIWHSETPILRTAPAPMYLLSGLVRERGYKVVLTGEGADEFLAGYDIYKENRIRRFWAGQPESLARPKLFNKIYPDIAALHQGTAYLASFFGTGLADLDNPAYSHMIRWRTTSRTKRFFSEDLQDRLSKDLPGQESPIEYPADFSTWPPLGKAQYLEAKIFLPQYLLSSQGDRMGMAHSVEGRYPFLDYRLIEFCSHLPPGVKMLGLTEKYLLKKLARKWLPEETWKRTKRPYRAPIHRGFFNQETPDYVAELLSEPCLRQSNLFNPEAVGQLLRKLQAGKRLGETDDMALAGILSTMLLNQQFVLDFHLPPPIRTDELNRDIRGAV
jgi:asparagine synthase (glutamine-hydrolysing)